jgi:hypothetical protein
MLVIVPVLAAGVIWAANVALVGSPVTSALNEDPRNSVFELQAHYGYYVNPNTLVLNLTRSDSAAPIDLFRGIFQAAGALNGRGRTFDRVVLANGRKAVFLMEGQNFDELGAEFTGGQNPVYLVRTLPEILLLPSGTPAFGKWEGGLFGVLARQMADATEAARAWAEGRPPNPQSDSD